MYQNTADTLFTTFYSNWLKHHQLFIEENTYNSYYQLAHKHILPYFEKSAIKLTNITTDILYNYYQIKMREGLSAKTLRHHHANIHSALNYAKDLHLIEFNPASGMKLPQNKNYHAEFYSIEELYECLRIFENHELELCVMLAGIMSLRRSEILGLTWNCINLKHNTITIKNTAVTTTDSLTGKNIIVKKNRTKNKSSYRTLVLPTLVLKKIETIRNSQKQPIAKNSPLIIGKDNQEIKPDRLTRNFKRHLEINDMKIIRFHDLRHSCTTTLFDLGYDMKDIQIWLGHSNISTTADIYTHYQIGNKRKIALTLNERLSNSIPAISF